MGQLWAPMQLVLLVQSCLVITELGRGLRCHHGCDAIKAGISSYSLDCLCCPWLQALVPNKST